MAKVTAISSLGWAHYTLYEAIPRIAARGFKRMEIASLSTYCFHFRYGSPEPQDLRKMLDEHNLTTVGLNFSYGVGEAWDESQIDVFLRELTRKVEQLGTVGIPMMTMFFGRRNTRDDQEYQLSNAVKAYDRMGRIAADYGVRMLLEVPHLYTIWPRPEQVFWIFDRLESPNVGALVDSSHWGIIHYDPDEFFSRLGDRLWHIHLRDSRGADTADRRQGFELTPGKGRADFRKFGQALDRASYSGDVTLEFEYRDMTLERIEQEFDYGIKHLAGCGWEIPDGVKYT